MSDIIKYETQSLIPKTLQEVMTVAQVITNSGFCPTAMKGKTNDVAVCIMMGAEVGLSPMQAVQNIAVINGRPSIWGDAALALCKVNPSYQEVKEWLEEKDGMLTAHCSAARKNGELQVRTFSIDDAKTANLWKKAGPWTSYPKRMLQMRARGFALRDVFPDALKGLWLIEESEDIPTAAQRSEKSPNGQQARPTLSENLQRRAAEQYMLEPPPINMEPEFYPELSEPTLVMEDYAVKLKFSNQISSARTEKALTDLIPQIKEQSQVVKDALRNEFEDKLSALRDNRAPAMGVL